MRCHQCGDSFHANCIRFHFRKGCKTKMGQDKMVDTLYNEAILARWGNDQPHFHAMSFTRLMEAYQTTHMHRIDEPLVQCAGCFRMMPIQYARRCHRCWRLFHVICVRRHAMEGCAGSAVRLYAPVKESTYKYSLVMSTAIMGVLHLTLKVMRWGIKSMGSTWKKCFFILLMFSAFTLVQADNPSAAVQPTDC